MRRSGILLHVSSLPGRYGIGSFGKEAYRFVDKLKAAKQSYWQILPLGPTSYGDSPYQSFSTFAGNPYFIDLEMLIEEGILTKKECESIDFGSNPKKVDYKKLYEGRYELLHKAYERAGVYENEAFKDFVYENSKWIWDYALFMALKDYFNGEPFTSWPTDIRDRYDYSINYYREKLYFDIEFYQFLQYKFDEQWKKLKAYANENGVEIIGDIPIYVAMDSADTWAHPELFQIGEEGKATAVAGCPPDGFAPDGQLWGNPLYNWEYHRNTGFKWWIKRLKKNFEWYDVIRIDHFRGFDEYYSIPAKDKTAAGGHWEKGPGIELFNRIKEALGDCRLIAEDLGYVTDSVRRLVNESGYPGMKVLEFAFDSRDTGNANDYLPHNYTRNSVVYTGTHDNETVMGWLNDITEKEYNKVLEYFNLKKGIKHTEVCDAIVRGAVGSVSDTCIIPIQDYLHYDHNYRMNTPSTIGKNWMFRLTDKEMSDEVWKKIKYLTELYGRVR